MKVDLFDKKIITELDRDSSASISSLGKTLKRSKQFILYRLRRLEELGIITGYQAIVDMSKLGYFTFRVYFKLQHATEDEGTAFVAHVRKHHPQVWTITRMHGKWDYALFLGVQSISEFHTIWDDLMLTYKEHIKTYNVALYAPIHNFNRTFLVPGARVHERVYGAGSPELIDELDQRLIRIYAVNVRQSATEIARKLRIAPQTVRTRITSLEKRKIIVGYKIGLNLEALNFVGYRVDLDMISTTRNHELFEYCKQHENIYQVNKSIGGADFEMEFIVRDLHHLNQLIDEIKVKFHDVINDANYFGFSIFHILTYIPD